MTYGEKYQQTLKNQISGESFTITATYKYAEWNEFHTDKEGDGLWSGDKQILGTCDFTVKGCQTEKAAKAKIRNRVNRYYGE